ncbi:hypothetical protein HHK36_005815 [Tetracentron sinense]|uniref:Transcription factor CBF/NF-Y/archaeal histone domain-containing protein n=1 Tax=Tetracentron sinense TaxID=13715 RepID=A0A834ZM34_TETSI|nr:hypothetical protein HHK36_005815 [Tetracentron sinense]
MCSSWCFCGRSLISTAVFLLLFSGFLSFGFSSIPFTFTALILSTVLVFSIIKRRPITKDNAPKDDVLSSSGENLQEFEVDCQKLHRENEAATHENEIKGGAGQIQDYLARLAPDVMLERESSDRSSTSEASEVDWPFTGNLGQTPECSDDSISDDDSLIEIALPSGHYVGPKEESKLKSQPNFSDFLPDSIFRQQGLMELLAEVNEMNEEENLIEIDISMGSIKCSRKGRAKKEKEKDEPESVKMDEDHEGKEEKESKQEEEKGKPEDVEMEEDDSKETKKSNVHRHSQATCYGLQASTGLQVAVRFTSANADTYRDRVRLHSDIKVHLDFKAFLIVFTFQSEIMADSDNESGGQYNSNANSELSPREQDRFLPIANVSRIMKKALPANAKISKDAKETVQECVSEFISFITGEASDKCQREKRKTINGDDLLWAMTTLGFEEYVDPLKIYLQKFRELEGEKTSMGGRPAEKDGSGGGSSGGASAGGGGGGGSGSVINSGNSVGGYNGSGMYGGMMMMGHHQGQMYGSGSYHQMAVGSGGPGKCGSGSAGGGTSSGRPR